MRRLGEAAGAEETSTIVAIDGSVKGDRRGSDRVGRLAKACPIVGAQAPIKTGCIWR